MEKLPDQKVHPKDKANRFSHLFFYWQLSFLFKNFRQKILETDLSAPLKEHQSKFLGDQLEKVWSEEFELFGKNASLWKVLAKVFGKEFFYYGLVFIPLEFILRLSQPFLLWKLLSYYENPTSKNKVYIYASLKIVSTFWLVFGLQHMWFGLEHLGIKIRVACNVLIYRKCLNLSQEDLSEMTIGHIITLLAVDAAKFNTGLIRYVHYLWVFPIMTVIVLYFLYTILDGTAMVGVLVLLGFIPFQIFLTKRIASSGLKMAQKTDQRVRLMSEIVEGIKVIKMLAWEKLFFCLIEKNRKLEIKQLNSCLYPQAINVLQILCVGRTAIFFSILTYILTGHQLHSGYVFVLASFYELIKSTGGLFGPWGAIFVGESLTAVKRIEQFLKHLNRKNLNFNGISGSIVLSNIYNNNLNNINLTIESNQMVAIIGPVGCGKSTLLKVILQEISILKGSLQVGGTISYASQEPWIFEGTIKDNILFGENHNEEKYNQVVKICSLEQDFSSLPYGDLTFIGGKGVVLSGGQKSRVNLARALYKDADFYLLDDPLSSVDARVGNFIFNSCFKNYLKYKTRVLVMHQLQYLPEVDFIYLVGNGKIVDRGTYDDLKSNYYFKMLQIEKTEKEDTISQTQDFNLKKFKEMPEEKENLKRGVVSRKVYKNYLKSGGSLVIFLGIILLHVLVHFCGGGTDYLLKTWVNLQQTKKDFNSCLFFYIYIGGICMLLPISLLSACTFVKFLVNASKNLHNKLLETIMNAPMKFFNENTSGRILNRFSSDIAQIDRNLPIVIIDVILVTMTFVALVTLIATSNSWILLPTMVMVLIFWYMRRIYLNTSRDLKRMEANLSIIAIFKKIQTEFNSTARSPVFSHLNTTLQGLTTIRALNAFENQKSIFEKHQDAQTSASYMFLACDSAFGFWLDLCCFVYFAIVIILNVISKNSEIYGGDVGLSVVSASLLIGMLQYGMKEYANMENQMVSVERVLEYAETKTESSEKKITKWLTNGTIKFKNVCFRYNSDHPLVLNNLTFTINSNEKIGIVGRTGAGKSSIVSILFRLFEFEGEISIDGFDIKSVQLQDFRSKISIIPQEPVLFSCSIRKNLDPFDEYEDECLWKALEEVEMRGLIASLPSGLSTKLFEGGLNFSVGQKQLLCLARAIVRMNKIVVLDEVTANVDLKTDELIRNSIRKTFKECTVLTIAHRIQNVMECDRVLVLDEGCVVEFDSPRKLLQDTKGAFYGLFHSGTSRII